MKAKRSRQDEGTLYVGMDRHLLKDLRHASVDADMSLKDLLEKIVSAHLRRQEKFKVRRTQYPLSGTSEQ